MAYFHEVKALDAGRQGDVMICRDCHTSKLFAMKIFFSPSVMWRERFALEKLSRCANVVQLFDIEIPERETAISLTYYTNGDLYSFIKNNSPSGIDEKIAKTLFRQIVNGCYLTHCNNIAHRDIKPENIFLCGEYIPYLGDYGLSSNIDIRFTGVIGSRPFIAPESFLIDAEYDGKAVDIWALGVTFFIMLVGYYPFGEEGLECKSNNWFYQQLRRNNISSLWTDYYDKYNEKSVSSEAKEILGKIFVLDPSARMTATDLLSHPWLNENLLSPDELNTEMAALDKSARLKSCNVDKSVTRSHDSGVAQGELILSRQESGSGS